MKLLNLCCGNCRQPSTPDVEWVNVDNLHATILPGTPERENLDREGNYFNCNVIGKSFDGTVLIPASWAETFDAILASHCFEHWDCQDAAYVMKQCRHLLKPGGILLVSVPDATYFKTVHDQDTVENAQELFGEPIHLPDGENTFTGYALWNRWHKAILTEDVLWHYFRRAGFKTDFATWRGGLAAPHWTCVPAYGELFYSAPMQAMVGVLNRMKFSLCMAGVKE